MGRVLIEFKNKDSKITSIRGSECCFDSFSIICPALVYILKVPLKGTETWGNENANAFNSCLAQIFPCFS